MDPMIRKTRMVLAAAATVLLAGCGQTESRTGNAMLSASSNEAAPTPAQADTPRAGGAQETPPTNLSTQLVGRWGRNSSCTDWMDLRADGSFALSNREVAPEVRWTVHDTSLVLVEPGAGERTIGSVVMAGNRFEMTHPQTGEKGTMVRCPG